MQPLTISPTFDGRRTIPSPAVTRVMLELLELQPGDKVLEIGTGSGYQTQELAKTGAEVHSIELEPWVDPTKIHGDCVFLHSGDGARGLPEEAPFDAIMATCGLEVIPQAWEEQLADGGRLVVPIGDSQLQRLVLLRKQKDFLRAMRVAAYVKFQMLQAPPAPKPLKYNPYDQCRS